MSEQTPAIIVDGKAIAARINEETRARVARLPRAPKLVAVSAGVDAASAAFLNVKRKAAEALGIAYAHHAFPENISTGELRRRIARLREEHPTATSFIIQLPLSPHLNTQHILDAVPPTQDPDALSTRAKGLLASQKPLVVPPTAAAVLRILAEHGLSPAGLHTVLVGHGRLVGRPLAALLADTVASLTIVTEATPDIAHLTRHAQLLICGAGVPGLVTGDMVGEGVIALDAGYSTIGTKVSGDLRFASVAPKARLITPVPGGVGPVSVALLLQNVVTLAELSLHVAPHTRTP